MASVDRDGTEGGPLSCRGTSGAPRAGKTVTHDPRGPRCGRAGTGRDAVCRQQDAVLEGGECLQLAVVIQPSTRQPAPCEPTAGMAAVSTALLLKRPRGPSHEPRRGLKRRPRFTLGERGRFHSVLSGCVGEPVIAVAMSQSFVQTLLSIWKGIDQDLRRRRKLCLGVSQDSPTSQMTIGYPTGRMPQPSYMPRHSVPLRVWAGLSFLMTGPEDHRHLLESVAVAAGDLPLVGVREQREAIVSRQSS